MRLLRRAVSGSLDLPAERAECAGSIEVSGWALSSAGTIDHVEVFLGDRKLGGAAYGQPRSDILAQYPGAHAACGFRGRFSIGVDSKGARTLIVRLTDSAGNVRSLKRRIVVVPGTGPQIVGSLDAPTEHAACADRIEIEGWSFSRAGAIERVEAFLGDQRLGVVAYGNSRPDIAAAYNDVPTADCGFRGRFATDFETVGNGERMLTVRVMDAAGNALSFGRAITFAQAARIYGSLDLPSERAECAGRVEVAGWSFSNVARVERIEIFLGEHDLGTAVYGEHRPEVSAVYPDAPSSACGFRERFRLDVDGIGLGPQTLAARVADAAGNQRSFERTIVVTPPPPICGGLDLPAQHAGCASAVEVGGWAFSTAGMIERIEVFLDDRKLGNAVYGYERLDVAVEYPNAPSDGVGFYQRFRFDAAQAERGARTLGVRISDSAGNTIAFERSILIASGALDAGSSDVFFHGEIDDLMARVRRWIDVSAQAAQEDHPSIDAVSYLSPGEEVLPTLDEIRHVLTEMGRSLDDVQHVLDFGCRSPGMLEELRGALNGAEIRGAALRARNPADPQAERDAAPIAPLAEWPPLAEPDASIELVVDCGTLSSFDEPHLRAWLAELERLTRPEGVVLVSLDSTPSPDTRRDGAAMAVPWQGAWKSFFEIGACIVPVRGAVRRWLVLRRRPRHALDPRSTDPAALPAFSAREGSSDASIVRSVVLENEYRLPAVLAADAVVVDVGAHIGSFSWAVTMRGAAAVYTYEPDPGNWERASSMLQPFGGRVRVERAAVWRSDRTDDALALSAYEQVGGFFNTGSPGLMNPEPGAHRVASISFDRVVEDATRASPGRVRLVKLDCEGAEYPILYTSKRLDRIDALCGEYHNLERVLGYIPEIARVDGFDRYDGVGLCAYLRARGFVVDLMPRGERIGLFFAHRPESGFRFQ